MLKKNSVKRKMSGLLRFLLLLLLSYVPHTSANTADHGMHFFKGWGVGKGRGNGGRGKGKVRRDGELEREGGRGTWKGKGEKGWGVGKGRGKGDLERGR